MGYYLVFGLASTIIGAVLFLLLYGSTTWHPYLAWLAAWWVTTFVVYGVDKGLAKARGPRVPELILNLLAVVGGFGGSWLGMLVFRHKSSMRRHLTIWAVLILSTAGHVALIYFWLLKG